MPISQNRKLSKLDNLIVTINKFIEVLDPSNIENQRENPANNIQENDLSTAEKKHSAQMMRVNHSGEVAAQALYLGQAITARDNKKRDFLLQSAIEEKDHLIWCNERLKELNSRTSFLNPFWFVGSVVIGAIAGAAGDKWSMGFLAETEYQVTSHIDKHLNKISPNDKKTIAILEQMRIDELEHATNAINHGGAELPLPIKVLMENTAKVMTISAKYI